MTRSNRYITLQFYSFDFSGQRKYICKRTIVREVVPLRKNISLMILNISLMMINIVVSVYSRIQYTSPSNYDYNFIKINMCTKASAVGYGLLALIFLVLQFVVVRNLHTYVLISMVLHDSTRARYDYANRDARE